MTKPTWTELVDLMAETDAVDQSIVDLLQRMASAADAAAPGEPTYWRSDDAVLSILRDLASARGLSTAPAARRLDLLAARARLVLR